VLEHEGAHVCDGRVGVEELVLLPGEVCRGESVGVQGRLCDFSMIGTNTRVSSC
jgi:hypothetical protein